MGLFFNRKNKNNVTVNDYQKTETSDISGHIKEYDNPYKDYNNPKFHRTENEKELKSDFFRNNRDFIEDFEQHLYSDKNDNSDDLKTRIEYFDEFKEMCYSSGEGGKLYFQDMWEHCHNSKNDAFLGEIIF